MLFDYTRELLRYYQEVGTVNVNISMGFIFNLQTIITRENDLEADRRRDGITI